MKTPIAIDGPVASGKSVVGERLAKRLGALFLDTGAMYRACAWKALQAGIAPDDATALGELARRIDLVIEQPTVPDGRAYTVRVEGQDVTWALRTPAIERIVSAVSAVPAVREAMVARQREIARQGPVVMVGRDIGTVVLPEAPLKVYLTATAATRARRRLADYAARGEPIDYATLLAAIERRDALDSSRAHSPLRPADDAVLLATDDLTIDEVVDRIYKLASDP